MMLPALKDPDFPELQALPDPDAKPALPALPDLPDPDKAGTWNPLNYGKSLASGLLAVPGQASGAAAKAVNLTPPAFMLRTSNKVREIGKNIFGEESYNNPVDKFVEQKINQPLTNSLDTFTRAIVNNPVATASDKASASFNAISRIYPDSMTHQGSYFMKLVGEKRYGEAGDYIVHSALQNSPSIATTALLTAAGAPAPLALLGAGELSGGQKFSENLRKEVDPLANLTNSTFNEAFEIIGEKYGSLNLIKWGRQQLKEVGKAGLKQGMKKITQALLGAAGTGFLEESMTQGAQDFTDLVSGTADFSSKDIPGRMLDAGLAGALMESGVDVPVAFNLAKTEARREILQKSISETADPEKKAKLQEALKKIDEIKIRVNKKYQDEWKRAQDEAIKKTSNLDPTVEQDQEALAAAKIIIADKFDGINTPEEQINENLNLIRNRFDIHPGNAPLEAVKDLIQMPTDELKRLTPSDLRTMFYNTVYLKSGGAEGPKEIWGMEDVQEGERTVPRFKAYTNRQDSTGRPIPATQDWLESRTTVANPEDISVLNAEQNMNPALRDEFDVSIKKAALEYQQRNIQQAPTEDNGQQVQPAPAPEPTKPADALKDLIEETKKKSESVESEKKTKAQEFFSKKEQKQIESKVNQSFKEEVGQKPELKLDLNKPQQFIEAYNNIKQRIGNLILSFGALLNIERTDKKLFVVKGESDYHNAPDSGQKVRSVGAKVIYPEGQPTLNNVKILLNPEKLSMNFQALRQGISPEGEVESFSPTAFDDFKNPLEAYIKYSQYHEIIHVLGRINGTVADELLVKLLALEHLKILAGNETPNLNAEIERLKRVAEGSEMGRSSINIDPSKIYDGYWRIDKGVGSGEERFYVIRFDGLSGKQVLKMSGKEYQLVEAHPSRPIESKKEQTLQDAIKPKIDDQTQMEREIESLDPEVKAEFDKAQLAGVKTVDTAENMFYSNTDSTDVIDDNSPETEGLDEKPEEIDGEDNESEADKIEQERAREEVLPKEFLPKEKKNNNWEKLSDAIVEKDNLDDMLTEFLNAAHASGNVSSFTDFLNWISDPKVNDVMDPFDMFDLFPFEPTDQLLKLKQIISEGRASGKISPQTMRNFNMNLKSVLESSLRYRLERGLDTVTSEAFYKPNTSDVTGANGPNVEAKEAQKGINGWIRGLYSWANIGEIIAWVQNQKPAKTTATLYQRMMHGRNPSVGNIKVGVNQMMRYLKTTFYGEAGSTKSVALGFHDSSMKAVFQTILENPDKYGPTPVKGFGTEKYYEFSSITVQNLSELMCQAAYEIYIPDPKKWWEATPSFVGLNLVPRIEAEKALGRPLRKMEFFNQLPGRLKMQVKWGVAELYRIGDMCVEAGLWKDTPIILQRKMGWMSQKTFKKEHEGSTGTPSSATLNDASYSSNKKKGVDWHDSVKRAEKDSNLDVAKEFHIAGSNYILDNMVRLAKRRIGAILQLQDNPGKMHKVKFISYASDVAQILMDAGCKFSKETLQVRLQGTEEKTIIGRPDFNVYMSKFTAQDRANPDVIQQERTIFEKLSSPVNNLFDKMGKDEATLVDIMSLGLGYKKKDKIGWSVLRKIEKGNVEWPWIDKEIEYEADQIFGRDKSGDALDIMRKMNWKVKRIVLYSTMFQIAQIGFSNIVHNPINTIKTTWNIIKHDPLAALPVAGSFVKRNVMDTIVPIKGMSKQQLMEMANRDGLSVAHLQNILQLLRGWVENKQNDNQKKIGPFRQVFRDMMENASRQMFETYIANWALHNYVNLRERFITDGLNEEEAGRRAAAFINLVENIPGQAIYGKEEGLLTLMLFAREYAVNTVRIATGAFGLRGDLTQRVPGGKYVQSVFWGETTRDQIKYLQPHIAHYWITGTVGFMLLLAVAQLAFQAASGRKPKFPWENEEGHKLDIDTGFTDKYGRPIYLATPMGQEFAALLQMMPLPGVGKGMRNITDRFSASVRLMGMLFSGFDRKGEEILPQHPVARDYWEAIKKISDIALPDYASFEKDDRRSAWEYFFAMFSGHQIKRGMAGYRELEASGINPYEIIKVQKRNERELKRARDAALRVNDKDLADKLNVLIRIQMSGAGAKTVIQKRQAPAAAFMRNVDQSFWKTTTPEERRKILFKRKGNQNVESNKRV